MTFKLVSPFARLFFVVPVTVTGALDLPSKLAGTFLEFRANVRLEVNWWSAFLVVAALAVLWSLQLGSCTIGILLFDTLIWTRAELKAYIAFMLGSNSVIAWQVFRARLWNGCHGFASWRANDGSCRCIRKQIGIWYPFGVVFDDGLSGRWFYWARRDASRFSRPWNEQRRLNTVEFVFLEINASNKIGTVCGTWGDIQSVLLGRRAERSVAKCHKICQKNANEKHFFSRCYSAPTSNLAVNSKQITENWSKKFIL